MTVTLLDLANACLATYNYDGKSPPPTWQDSEKLVHVYLSTVGGMPCIAFEGTTDLAEWMVDFMAAEIPVFGHLKCGPMHAGFYRDVSTVLPQIMSYLAGLGWPPYLNTGHSKGGGECLVFHGLMKDLGHPPMATAAFEPPMVGSSILTRYLADQKIVWTQTANVHGKDFVTLVPPGPTWSTDGTLIPLTVPDADDIAAKHRIPSVIASIAALNPLPILVA